MFQQISGIQQITHTSAASGAGDVALALAVAAQLHAPVPPTRAPEVALAPVASISSTAAARHALRARRRASRTAA